MASMINETRKSSYLTRSQLTGNGISGGDDRFLAIWSLSALPIDQKLKMASKADIVTGRVGQLASEQGAAGTWRQTHKMACLKISGSDQLHFSM